MAIVCSCARLVTENLECIQRFAPGFEPLLTCDQDGGWVLASMRVSAAQTHCWSIQTNKFFNIEFAASYTQANTFVRDKFSQNVRYTYTDN